LPVDVAVGLLAAKGAEALVVGAAAPPALRVLNAFEKENALPGTAVLDVTVVLDVAGTAAVTAAGTTAGLDTVVVNHLPLKITSLDSFSRPMSFS